MHNDSVRPSGQWFPGLVPCARDLRKLDDIGSRSVNGDDGGTWTPATPIILGGGGFTGTSATTSIEGGVITARGGRMQLYDGSGLRFSGLRTHSVLVPLIPTRRLVATLPPLQFSADPYGLKNTYVDPVNPVYYDFPVLPSYVHFGATLVSAVLTFRVGAARSALPANYPAFSLSLLPYGHNSVLYLHTGANGLVARPAAATAIAYYALGAAQTITLTCDQNNTAIDSEYQNLMLTIRDEYGANALSGNIYHSLLLNFSSIPDMRFE